MSRSTLLVSVWTSTVEITREGFIFNSIRVSEVSTLFVSWLHDLSFKTTTASQNTVAAKTPMKGQRQAYSRQNQWRRVLF